MVNLNLNLSSQSYSSIPSRFSRNYQIEIYDNEGNLKSINAYVVDPYKLKNFKPKSLLVKGLNKIKHKKAFSVCLEEYPYYPLYVKVSEISRLLNLNESFIKQNIKKDATTYLTNQNIQTILSRILSIPAHLKDQTETLVRELGYRQFLQILKPEFEVIDQVYLDHLAILHHDIQFLYKQFKISLNVNDIKALMILLSHVHPNHLIQMIERVESSYFNCDIEKTLDIKTLLNTFLFIGYDLWKSKSNTPIYRGKVKATEDLDHLPTYAYAIDGSKIFIVGLKLKLKGSSGTSIHDAFYLNDITISFIRRKKLPNNRFSFVDKACQELDLHNQLVKEHVSIYISETFVLHIQTKTKDQKSNDSPNKWIYFQMKYPEQGENLYLSSLPQILRAYYGAAQGLADLHAFGYVHMDFKPRNFLLDKTFNEDELAETKLIDFEFTTKIGEYARGCTFAYLAPEGLNWRQTKHTHKIKKIYSTIKIDSFSLGVSIIETLAKKYHFPNYSSPSILQFHFRRLYLAQCSQKKYDLMFDQLKQKVESITYITFTEKQILLYLLNICYYLLIHDPEKRWSCSQAAENIKFIEKFTIN